MKNNSFIILSPLFFQLKTFCITLTIIIELYGKIKIRKMKVGGVKVKGLNMKKLEKEKNLTIISSKDALKDVTPINWTQEVLQGKRKIEVDFKENYMHNETEKCEWDTISDIFSKAVRRQNITKSDIEKMIVETKNEERRK